MHVLIVDDDEDIAWSLTRLLRRLGHEVVACGSPTMALDAVGSFHPDLVFLDIELPEMNGYTLAVRLRDNGLENTPIFTLSALDDDPIKRLSASIEAHYVKPVGVREIAQILTSVSSADKEQRIGSCTG